MSSLTENSVTVVRASPATSLDLVTKRAIADDLESLSSPANSYGWFAADYRGSITNRPDRQQSVPPVRFVTEDEMRQIPAPFPPEPGYE